MSSRDASNSVVWVSSVLGAAAGAFLACGAQNATPEGFPACGPVSKVISDFASGSWADGGVTYGVAGKSFSGKIVAYGKGVTADTSGDDFHVSGTVAGTSAGLQAYFDNLCVADATAYKGLSFAVSGTIGDAAPNKTITFWVGTVEDSVTSAWLATLDAGTLGSSLASTPGTCTPTSGDRVIHPGCRNPVYTLNLTSPEKQTVRVKWEDFTNGQPNVTAAPGRLTLIGWRLPSPTSTDAGVTSFPVDIHIDDLQFIE